MTFNVPYNPPESFSFFADTFYDRLEENLSAVQRELKEDEQLNVLFYTAAGEPIAIEDIGYHNPTLLIIFGKDSTGNDCRVLTHVYAAQLIMTVTKAKKGEPKKAIGFVGKVTD